MKDFIDRTDLRVKILQVLNKRKKEIVLLGLHLQMFSVSCNGCFLEVLLFNYCLSPMCEVHISDFIHLAT